MLVFRGLILLVALMPDANNVIYDSEADPSASGLGHRVQLYEREKDETPTPPDAPTFELLTQPCMGWHFQAGTLLHNADTGRDLLLLTSAIEMGGAALVAVAPDENTSSLTQLPGTAGAWAMTPMTRDRVALGTYYDGAVHVFDLAAWEITDVIDVPGEAYVWNMAVGGDGRLYGGTFPGGKLFAMDQDTLNIEDCGAVAPPNRFVHHISPLPDGRILCHAGDEAPAIRIYDPRSKSFSHPPETLGDIREGVVWQSHFLSDNRVFDPALNPVNPPFPLPAPEQGEWSVISELTTPHTLFLRQDNRVYRYDHGDDGLTQVFDGNLRGGRFVGASVTGNLVGVRGQQYFTLGPGDVAPRRQTLKVASPPRVPAFLRADPKGQVWGAPHMGQTLFFMDGETGVFVSMGSVCPRPGSVADLAFLNGVAYGVSQPGNAIFRLDIEQAWNEWDDKNPSTLFAPSVGGYSATGGIVATGDGRLLSGWTRPGAPGGGAIAVTHATDSRTRFLENPLGPQGITGLAIDDEHVFACATPPPGDEAKSPLFAVLGLDTLQVYWNHVFDGADHVDRALYLPGERRVVMAVDSLPAVFDVTTMSMSRLSDEPPPSITSADIVQRGDAHFYYGHEETLIRMHSVSGAWEEMLELPGEIGGIAALNNGTIHVSCDTDVYRILMPGE